MWSADRFKPFERRPLIQTYEYDQLMDLSPLNWHFDSILFIECDHAMDLSTLNITSIQTYIIMCPCMNVFRPFNWFISRGGFSKWACPSVRPSVSHSSTNLLNICVSSPRLSDSNDRLTMDSIAISFSWIGSEISKFYQLSGSNDCL